MSFLYELPRSVKVVITTRERVLSFSPLRLDQLSQEESLLLIEKEIQEKKGIDLQAYQQPLPSDPTERSRLSSLKSLAYKRVGICMRKYDLEK